MSAYGGRAVYGIISSWIVDEVGGSKLGRSSFFAEVTASLLSLVTRQEMEKSKRHGFVHRVKKSPWHLNEGGSGKER